jgi:hypothetical protein
LIFLTPSRQRVPHPCAFGKGGNLTAITIGFSAALKRNGGWAGGPPFDFLDAITSEGAPSLRFWQGWEPDCHNHRIFWRVAQPSYHLCFFFPIPKRWVPRSRAFGEGGYDTADTMRRHACRPASHLRVSSPALHHLGAGPALLFGCATTNGAAPAFVVFESWAPHSLRAGLSSRHIHGLRLCANRSSCPTNFAATTVRDISISLRPVVISGSLCSRGHRIATCCFVSWRVYGGDTISW